MQNVSAFSKLEVKLKISWINKILVPWFGIPVVEVTPW